MKNLMIQRMDRINTKHVIVISLLTALLFIAFVAFCTPAQAETGVKVKVGEKTFNGVLYDNPTSKALMKRMPLSYKMSDLNKNEKYKYLSYTLPTNEKAVRRIKAEDSGAGSTQTKPAEGGKDENVMDTSKEKNLSLYIDDTKVSVSWLDNESTAKLKEMARTNPVVINMSRYGGFEQVGSIGTSLPRNDVQMTTSPGDIVLYSGDQMVIFYGSNSWAYTKLGHIENMSTDELAALLSGADRTIKLVME